MLESRNSGGEVQSQIRTVQLPDKEIVRRQNFVIAATVDGFLCYGTKEPLTVDCHRAVAFKRADKAREVGLIGGVPPASKRKSVPFASLSVRDIPWCLLAPRTPCCPLYKEKRNSLLE